MYYKPHKLYIKRHSEIRDDYGRLVECDATYEYMAPCRCDDNSDREVRNDNGDVFIPKHHIVAEGRLPVSCGDEVRVTMSEPCCCDMYSSVKAEGKVLSVKVLNYLDYTDIWV